MSEEPREEKQPRVLVLDVNLPDGLGVDAVPELREVSPGTEIVLLTMERDPLRLMALGHTNREIAEQLNLSVRTIETHRSHIQQKLGLSSRPELTRYALDHGLIDA